MNIQPAPDALRLYDCVITRFVPTEQTVAPRCECGDLLADVAEQEAGQCFSCQAEEAGCSAGFDALPSHPIFGPLFEGLLPGQAYLAQQPAAPALQTLGCAPEEVIDVEPEARHPLDGDEDPETTVQQMLDQLEEAGVAEAGLKRKDWSKALKAWNAIWPEECELEVTKKVYDLLTVALARNPVSWDVPTEKEVIDHERKLAIASGE